MLDTTVLIPGLPGGRLRASDDAASPLLFEAMIAARKTILIAAPSAAELIRRSPKTAIPRTRQVFVVAFDRTAAEILGERFPPTVLTVHRDESAARAPLHYIKYDAMIVACAVRHRANVLISCDADQRKLAAKVGLSAAVPSDYLALQPRLPHT